MDIEVKKLADIQRIFNDEKPKFIALVDANSQYIVPWNNPQITSQKRFTEVVKKLSSKSLPDGIYYFLYKDNLNRSVAEYRVAVGKGNVSKQVALKENAIVNVPAESVWSVAQAVDILSQNNFLSLENAALKKEVQDLDDYIKELEAKEHIANPGMNENSSGFLGDMTEFVKLLAPVWDDHVKLEREKLDLKKQQLSQMGGGHGVVSQNGQRRSQQPQVKLREDKGVDVNDPAYLEYFKQVYDQGSDEVLSYELDVLAQLNPQLYEQLVAEYQIEVTPADSSEGGGTGTTQES